MTGSSPGAARPDLGVVVVSYNTRELLDRCLTSLCAEVRRAGLSAETWVVDNASTDGTTEMVAAQHASVTLVTSDRNLGYAAGCNRALRHFFERAAADGTPRWSLVLNPDTEIRPGAIEALIGALDTWPGAAIAGPRLEYPDGRLQHSAFRFPGLGQTILDLFPIPRWQESKINGRYPVRLYDGGVPFAVDFPLGACMLVRTEAITSVGLMDASFFMYCEEIDWCRRFAAAGFEAICVPRARVMHVAGASTSQFRSAMFVALWRSRLRYFRKHETPRRAALLAGTIRAGLGARLWIDRIAYARGRLDEAELADRTAAYREVTGFRQPADSRASRDRP